MIVMKFFRAMESHFRSQHGKYILIRLLDYCDGFQTTVDHTVTIMKDGNSFRKDNAYIRTQLAITTLQ